MPKRWSCSLCGETWDEHPFLQLPCPTCHARAGVWCVRPSGHSGPFIEIHVDREQAVLDAGLIKKCTAAHDNGRSQKKAVNGQLALPI